MAHYDCGKCGKGYWECRCEASPPIGKSPTHAVTEPSEPTNATSTEQPSAGSEHSLPKLLCMDCNQPIDFCACILSDAISQLRPDRYSVWRHKSGRTYVVLGLTNEHSDDEERYPVTVRYADRDGKEWSRPFSRWHESMTLVPNPPAGMADHVLSLVDPWYGAVTEACTVAHINYFMDNPKATLNALLNWHVQVALDPAVSSDARDLMQKGRDEILNGETKACYDEGCPHHGKAIRCEPHPGGCTATVPTPVTRWSRIVNEQPVKRYPVPGGWLVMGRNQSTFVPDPDHKWV